MNPYTAPALVPATAAAEPSCDYWSFRRHFLLFNAAFIAGLFVDCCVYYDLTTALTSFVANQTVWLIRAGVGMLVWMTHAIILYFSPSLRMRGPSIVGLVGASTFVAFAVVLRLIEHYGPHSITIPWSWIPEPVRIAFYTGGSIAGVVLLALIPSRRRQNV